MRRSYYVDGAHAEAIEALPAALKAVAGLDDPSAVRTTRLEIGGGPHAQQGFLHVDIDPGAHHLEWVAPRLGPAAAGRLGHARSSPSTRSSTSSRRAWSRRCRSGAACSPRAAAWRCTSPTGPR